MKAKQLMSVLCALALALTLSAAQAQETPQDWATPCFSGEADYTYTDDARSIAIQRIVWDESTGYVADVQLRDGRASMPRRPKRLRGVVRDGPARRRGTGRERGRLWHP